MPAPVEIGQILAGKYRVDRVLGEGGMGVVVAAWHLELEAMVALKFLLPDILENSTAIDRFLREARAAVKLKSEHTCQVRDVGRLENGAPYIVMEYLEGCDLLEELRRRGALPVPEIASLISQACKAMTEAHAVGIVHRDLKPQNLFLTHRGDGTPLVKVLDFGIAKLRLQDGSATQTAVVMGSPAYMAPEQARSAKHADLRADIYSLGVILYQLTTGRLPFAALEKPTGELSLTEVLLSVQMDQAIPLRAYHGQLPHGWEEVVMCALAKDPQYRYQNASQLADALAPFVNQRSTPMPFAAVAPPVGYQTGQTGPGYQQPQAQQTGHPTHQTVGSTPPMRNATNQDMPGTAASTTLSAGIHAGPSLGPPGTKKKWMVPVIAGVVVVLAVVAFAAVKGGGGGGDEPTTETQGAKPPDPTKPEPAQPEPTKPEPVAEPVKPEPAKPEPVTPEPVTPEPAKPDPIAAKPAPVKPEPTKPTTKPKPTSTKPKPTTTVAKPEPTKPEPTKPVAKPEPKKPEPKKPCRSDDVVCQFGKK
jgi:serine/threonine-protein kinase